MLVGYSQDKVVNFFVVTERLTLFDPQITGGPLKPRPYQTPTLQLLQ